MKNIKLFEDWGRTKGWEKIEIPTAESLRKHGSKINTPAKDGVTLWRMSGEEFLLFPDGRVMSRKKDNSDGRGAAIFPYPFKK